MNALEELVILIPSHSLEDFPSDLPEEEAAGLLNGFQILWDPRLLVASGTFPNWQRADEIPDVAPGRLIVVPQTCEYLLPAGWIARVLMSPCADPQLRDWPSACPALMSIAAVRDRPGRGWQG